jgi:hypothetical protein
MSSEEAASIGRTMAKYSIFFTDNVIRAEVEVVLG